MYLRKTIVYGKLAQLRKLEGPNYYQHKFSAGRRSLFHFDVELSL